jgi:multidrug efflux system membrane fusion protein
MNEIDHKQTALRAPLRNQEAVRHRSRLRHVVWIVPLVLLVAAIAWVSFRPQPATQGRPGRPGGEIAMPVGTAVAEKGDIPLTFNALGTVTPLTTVTVRTQISGYLMQIAFQEGQLVHAGDFLAQIDPRPYQAQLSQYQGQLAHDQALLNEARIDLARYATLVAQNSIAKQTYDTQASLVQQYIGTVATDQAQIDNAKLNLVYCHITAPGTGRLGLRQVDQGNYVTPSDTNGIVVLTQLEPISVIFTLPEDNLPAVMKRFKAGATLPVTAYDRSQTTQLATGKLLTIDNQIDTTTGTVKLRAQFDNQDGSLFPNQFVTTQILVDTMTGALVVPTAGIQRGVPGTFVYLVKPDNTVTVRPVKLGPSSGDRVAILSGLDLGDRIVVDGADKLREGSKVTLPAAQPPAGASPPPEGSKPPHRQAQ